MHCIYCTAKKTEVENTRITNSGATIWRRRKCPSCNETFSTYESPALDFLIVKKRSGKTTRYVREKLFASIYDALSSGKHVDCGDAALSARDVVGKIESLIRKKKLREISTTALVTMVTDELEQVNLGACYRYAAFSPHRGMRFGI